MRAQMPKTHKSHMWPNSLKIQNNSDIFGIEKVGGEVICKQNNNCNQFTLGGGRCQLSALI